MYNCGTWALTQAEGEKLNAFHRKQLRRVIGIHYHTKITNDALYEKSNDKPISETMIKARWKLFGHILRRDINIPANMAMKFYFKEHSNGFRGQPRTTLPAVLNKDLLKFQAHIKKKRKYTMYRGIRLESLKDLESINLMAQERNEWKKLIRRYRGETPLSK